MRTVLTSPCGIYASLIAPQHTGTFHGLSTVRLQAYADDLSWRYSHRGCDATTALVADCCLGYYRRDQLHGEVFGPQPPAAPARGRPRRGKRPDILRL